MTQFHAEASAELAEAVAYYDRQRSGPGGNLAEVVQTAVWRIEDFPEAHPIISPGVRRCRTKRFQYGVVYVVRPAGLYIVAVMHLRRRPDYWAGRLRRMADRGSESRSTTS